MRCYCTDTSVGGDGWAPGRGQGPLGGARPRSEATPHLPLLSPALPGTCVAPCPPDTHRAIHPSTHRILQTLPTTRDGGGLGGAVAQREPGRALPSMRSEPSGTSTTSSQSSWRSTVVWVLPAPSCCPSGPPQWSLPQDLFWLWELTPHQQGLSTTGGWESVGQLLKVVKRGTLYVSP